MKSGLAEPGELKLRRNVQDALKKIGGKVVLWYCIACPGRFQRYRGSKAKNRRVELVKQ